MKFKHFLLLPAMLFLATTLYSQVGIGTTDPSQAAMLEISSQTNGTGNYKGLMPPRVPNVAARDQIPATVDDDGLMVYVKDIGCVQMWDGSSWKDLYCFNYRPVVINPTVEGSLNVGQILEANFTYYDADGDPEGNHLYQWYRANDISGTSATTIPGATSATYELVAADTGKYIAVSITPVANSGTSPGIPAISPYQGPILVQALASDLFISEYVEGSSNNRAIEIANFTGGTINLNNYRLAIYANGQTGSQAPIGFIVNRTLADGDVYIIKHISASSSIIADQIDGGLTFTGNDAVALIKVSINAIIDVVGVIGSDVNFGQDKTLRKKPLFGPSTTYDAEDFNTYPVDTFNGLGWHTY